VDAKSLLKSVAAGAATGAGLAYLAWRGRELERERVGEAAYQRADRARRADRAPADTPPVPMQQSGPYGNPEPTSGRGGGGTLHQDPQVVEPPRPRQNWPDPLNYGASNPRVPTPQSQPRDPGKPNWQTW
jgi:hypothetical protein